jgi:hypothetical protein
MYKIWNELCPLKEVLKLGPYVFHGAEEKGPMDEILELAHQIAT